MKKALTLISILVIVIFCGCSFDFIKNTDEDIKNNTESIKIDNNSSLVIKPTLLGFGAELKAKLSKDQGVKDIRIEEFSPNEKISLLWQGKVREETEESKNAQKKYQEETKNLPIGENPAMPPEPEYIEEDISGKLIVNNLKSSDSMLLPVVWPAGDLELDDNSVIILSKDIYSQLLNTKKADLKMGMFGNIISKAKVWSYEMEQDINELKSYYTNVEDNSDKDAPYSLTAEDDFGDLDIQINGKKKKVQTIIASSWFGEYIILNNPDFPIILKMTPNPLAASFEFNIKTLFGYQVTGINY